MVFILKILILLIMILFIEFYIKDFKFRFNVIGMVRMFKNKVSIKGFIKLNFVS